MSGAAGSKVVVSLTPLALRRDSRTLKQASSVARFGYHSLVVEGQPSMFVVNRFPFELVSMNGATLADRTKKESLRALRLGRKELRRQCAAARSIILDHLNCVGYLERDVGQVQHDVSDHDERQQLL